MGLQTIQLVTRPALTGVLFAFIGTILINQTASAQVDVNAIIPEGIIVVEGKTSPNALVKLYENGNDQPTATVVADTNGNFSEELPQMSTGVVDIGIQALDASGIKTTLITKQVAIISQQTSTLTVILPPTITINHETAPYSNGTLEFSGQTIPGASVKVTIEPSTILSVTADSQGSYMIPLSVLSLPSVGIYTYGVEVIAGSEVSDYVTVGTFVITPPIQPPVVSPNTPLQRFVSRFVTSQLSAPEILSPSEDEYTSTDPIVISGRATPGTEITIYDAGEVIGIVLAGEDGNWQFYFSPYKETHTIYAQSCSNGRCSDNSRSVTILKSNASNQLCTPSIALISYRLSATTGDQATLNGILPKSIPGKVFISWGDSSDEKFDWPSSGELKATHAYQEAGVYSGYVIVNASTACQTATYFTVQVTNSTKSTLSTLLISAIIIGALSLGWLMNRTLPQHRSK